jgi:hypothetical protein
MAPQSYQLVVRAGPNPGRAFDLSGEEITIGRDISNDIVISDAEVSRHHARLVSQAGGYVLEDTGSTNGTFVNGQRLMGPHMLRPGEVILLGENISLEYVPLQYDEDATRVTASNVPSMPPASPQVPAQHWESTPQPQPQYPPAQQPYSGAMPPGPAESYMAPEEESPNRTWLYVGAGCLVVLLCVVIAGAVVFDQLNMYCQPPFDAFFYCP